MPPQISLSSVPSSYNEGSVVNITCTASGIPEPDVKWFRNGIMKSQGTKTVLLKFNNVSRTDDGQYECQANNSAGNSENYVALVVHCKYQNLFRALLRTCVRDKGYDTLALTLIDS